MEQILISPFILYFLLIFSILMMIGFAVMIIKYWLANKTDLVLLITKEKRYILHRCSLLGQKEFRQDKNIYKLLPKCALLNKSGKALYIFSEGRPEPMKLDYNDAQWIDSQSMHTVLNNDLIKKILQPTSAAQESLMLLGALGGIIAGIASTITCLKLLGVF